MNLDIRSARKLHRYDTPRPGDLEMPPPSQLLASVMSESIELETLELPKPEVSPSERVARSLLSAGEILYVFRPLIYVLAMRKWGAKKWKPWLLSLGVDAASMALIAAADGVLKKEGRGQGKEGGAGLTEQERSEVRAGLGTSSFPLKHVLVIESKWTAVRLSHHSLNNGRVKMLSNVMKQGQASSGKVLGILYLQNDEIVSLF